VGGLSRARLAAVNAATGGVIGGWRADANNTVYALAVSGSRLYAGGNFTRVAGQPRERLAAVDAATGALAANWKPRAYRPDGNNSTVRSLGLSPTNSSRLYAGGFFTYISGRPTGKLVALDASSGAVVGAFDPDVRDNILAMDISGGRVFVGAGDPLEGIAAFDASNGRRAWVIAGGHPDPAAGDVQAIVAKGTKVYAGGHFTQMGGLVRKRLVEVDAATGKIGPWAPALSGGNLGVWALEKGAVRGRLYAGGDFTQVAGRVRQRFAQFSDPTVDTEGPNVKAISPEPGSKTRDRTPTIRAKVWDASGELRAADIKLFVDGNRRSFRYVAGDKDLLSATHKLSRGGHTIRLMATDRFKNTTNRSWKFKVVVKK